MKKKHIVIFCITVLLPVYTIGYVQEAVAGSDEGENLNEVDELLEFEKYNSKEVILEQGGSEKESSQYKKKEKPNLRLKKLYQDDYNPCEEKLKKYESLHKVIDDYIHRYVNLFLRLSLLKNHFVVSADENIKLNLEISIKGEDLAFLQQYSNSSSSSAAQRNLSKLDDIMMNILKLKEKTIMEKGFELTKTFSQSFLSYCNYECLTITVSVLLTLIALLVAVKKFSLPSVSFFTVIWIVINCILIFEGWWTYKKKLKEKEVEMYVEAMGQKEIPEDCDPSKITWYKAWYNYIFGSDCLTYHLNLSKVATDEISIYQCIYDTYALYFIQKPFHFFGEAVGNFNKQLTDSLPAPFNLLVFIPISVFTVCIVAIFFLILCGSGLKISFFGTSLEIGKVGGSSRQSAVPSSSLSTTNNGSNSGTMAVKGVLSKPRARIKRLRTVSLERRPKKLTFYRVE